MPPTKFQLNLTYLSEADVVSRFSRWPLWCPWWIFKLNKFSNSKSPCHPNASHQVWTRSYIHQINKSIYNSVCTLNHSLLPRVKRQGNSNEYQQHAFIKKMIKCIQALHNLKTMKLQVCVVIRLNMVDWTMLTQLTK